MIGRPLGQRENATSCQNMQIVQKLLNDDRQLTVRHIPDSELCYVGGRQIISNEL